MVNADTENLFGVIDEDSETYDGLYLRSSTAGISPPGIRFRNDTNGNDWWIWQNEEANGDLVFSSETPFDGHEKIVFTRSGRVGINTMTPGYMFDICSGYNDGLRVGVSPATSLILTHFNNNPAEIPGSSFGSRIVAARSAHCLLDIRANDKNDGFYVRVPSDFGNPDDVDTPVFAVKATGNVGIGTVTPQNKLDVSGTIRAKEIIVESDWADFVFEEDYKLPSLTEVEQHIAEFGHLPGIPTEEDVESQGVSLGEMNARLLQKVEELTLYTIQQEGTIFVAGQQLNAQRKEIDELKAQNEAILKKLEKLGL